jgi:hypothetical protein
VSKLALARLPIPAVRRRENRRLSDWTSELQARRTGLKRITTEFQEAVALAEASGHLSTRLLQFWDLNKADMIGIISEALERQPLALRESILQRWIAAKRRVDEEWRTIESLERKAEERIAQLYGLIGHRRARRMPSRFETPNCREWVHRALATP